jgi:hypothetical protein
LPAVTGCLSGGHVAEPNECVWIEPVAKQLDAVVAIGDLYRFDRFAAPSNVWGDLQARFPELFNAA